MLTLSTLPQLAGLSTLIKTIKVIPRGHTPGLPDLDSSTVRFSSQVILECVRLTKPITQLQNSSHLTGNVRIGMQVWALSLNKILFSFSPGWGNKDSPVSSFTETES